MNSVRIGNAERSLQTADAQWVNQQIQGLRRDGLSICIRLNITQGDLNISLQTAGCGPAGGAYRQPNPHENAILDLWKKHHLDDSSFGEGNVVAFLQQLRSIVSA